MSNTDIKKTQLLFESLLDDDDLDMAASNLKEAGVDIELLYSRVQALVEHERKNYFNSFPYEGDGTEIFPTTREEIENIKGGMKWRDLTDQTKNILEMVDPPYGSRRIVSLPKKCLDGVKYLNSKEGQSWLSKIGEDDESIKVILKEEQKECRWHCTKK
jgi:hypothetical protein